MRLATDSHPIMLAEPSFNRCGRLSSHSLYGMARVPDLPLLLPSLCACPACLPASCSALMQPPPPVSPLAGRSKEAREKAVELLFEKYSSPGGRQRSASWWRAAPPSAAAPPIQKTGARACCPRVPTPRAWRRAPAASCSPAFGSNHGCCTQPLSRPCCPACSGVHGQECGAVLVCQRAADEPGCGRGA